MKTCPTCGQEKAVSEFNKNKSRKDGLNSVCRMCIKDFRKRHYEANSKKVYAEVKARRRGIADRVWSYKGSHPCVDCGESNPVVLDFDHVPERAQKNYNIAEMVVRGFSWERILEEIEKCEVVCANCHRIRTHRRAGWRKEG